MSHVSKPGRMLSNTNDLQSTMLKVNLHNSMLELVISHILKHVIMKTYVVRMKQLPKIWL